MDALDRAIITELQADGRQTNASLAERVGLSASATLERVRRLERDGASRVGYLLLYFVLASIGATTSLAHLAEAPVLIAAGFAWIAIHALFILAAARILHAPMSLLAAASQAPFSSSCS